MSTSDSPIRGYRVVSFSSFIFNLESGELSLRGRKLVLQEQHARVLGALLQQPGRVLSREDLRDTLWPGVAFVDYQHAINKAISQLRKVLNDDSRMPRFIETISKRGYRFCADVQIEESSVIKDLPRLAPNLPPDTPQPTPLSLVPPSTTKPTETQADLPAGWFTNKSWPLARGSLLSILLLLVAAVGTGSLLWVRQLLSLRPVAAAPITIGIPPFETSGEGAEPLAENFRLDLTDSLAQMPSVRIRAAHAFTAAPRDGDSVRSVARTQRLDVMVLGTFQLKDRICALNLELVRTADTSHLASFHYSGTPQQLRSVRDTIQRDIFTKLKLNQAPTTSTPDAKQPEAYAVYLEGRQHLNERTDDALIKASREFTKAISIDPKFADAYSGLATVILLQADRDPTRASYPEAKTIALRALAIDTSQAQAHAVLGCIAMSHEWKRATAEKELKTAVQLDPDEAVYHVWLAALLGLESRFEEAFQQVDLAREDDPYWPPVYQTEAALAASAAQSSRLLSATQKLVSLTPDWPDAHDQMAWAYWYSSQYAQAIAEWRNMAALAHDKQREEVETRGLVEFERGGVAAYAQLRLHTPPGHSGFNYRSKSLQDAEWAAYASDPERAITRLAAMVDTHDPSAVDAATDPAFLPLRDDPRYKSVLARINSPGV